MIKSLSKRFATIFPAASTNIPSFKVKNLTEDTCEISFDIPSGNIGSTEELVLGQYGDTVLNVIRLTREKVYWIFPTISPLLPAHTDTQLLLIQTQEGVAALLPLTTPQYMSNLRGAADLSPSVLVRLEREIDLDFTASMVVAFGSSIKEVVRDVVGAARCIRFPGKPVVKPLSEEHLFSGSLTYCTWNSLQPPTPATSTNALATLEYFSTKGVHPTTFLIDDAWQDVHNFRLQSFVSTPSFLDGLADLGELVKKAKEVYGVINVGAWHTIGGYWCGVEPAKFIDKYRLIKVTKDGYPGPFEPEGFSYYIPHPEDVGKFFNDYYELLASYGISFTKCDNMASLDNLVTAFEVDSYVSDTEEVLGKAVNIPSLRSATKNAVKNAAKKWFGSSEQGRVIWCMEMTPRVLMGEIGFAEEGTHRSVIRNSDDYYPDQPDSHRYHIFTNAVNALFTSQLNVIPDLDMFQSHPYIRPHESNGTSNGVLSSDNYPQAAFHAALRSLGAGPVTLTDVPGKTDSSILNKLIGSAKKGSRSIVLQAKNSPFVSNAIFDQTLLQGGTGKAFRVYSQASLGSGGIVGFWNIRSADGKVEDAFTLEDLRTLSGVEEIASSVVYSQKTHILRVLESKSSSLGLPIRLEPFQFDLVVVAGLTTFPEGQPAEIANFGLIDKYNSLATITSGGFEDETTYRTAVRCAGKLVLYIRKHTSLPKVTVDGRSVDPRAVAVAGGHMVTIDLYAFLDDRQADGDFIVEASFL